MINDIQNTFNKICNELPPWIKDDPKYKNQIASLCRKLEKIKQKQKANQSRHNIAPKIERKTL